MKPGAINWEKLGKLREAVTAARMAYDDANAQRKRNRDAVDALETACRKASMNLGNAEQALYSYVRDGEPA